MGRLVRQALRGVIRAACPLDSGPKIPAIVDRVELQVRTLMQYMAPVTAWGLCLVFLLVNWSQVWLLKGLRPLHSLPRKAAVKAARTLSRVRFRAVRELMLAVRATVVAAYYDQPEVHFALGYHPKPWIRKRLALRRRLLAGRHPTRDDLIPFAPPSADAHPVSP
jgi:hypothetical protein